jgi:restriction endonuclease Mrr
MNYFDRKLAELVIEVETHTGYGESKRFYEIRYEVSNKLGPKEWERMLRKAKVTVALKKRDQ